MKTQTNLYYYYHERKLEIVDESLVPSSSKTWVTSFRNNKQWKSIRFKIFCSGYPPLYMPADLTDLVDMRTFMTIEPNRIPLFMGTQFGVYPKIDTKGLDNLSMTFVVAIQGKSLLSGCVSGVTFHLQEGNKRRRLNSFPSDSFPRFATGRIPTLLFNAPFITKPFNYGEISYPVSTFTGKFLRLQSILRNNQVDTAKVSFYMPPSLSRLKLQAEDEKMEYLTIASKIAKQIDLIN